MDGTALSPGLIYKAVTGNIQDTWLEEFFPNQNNDCFFASCKRKVATGGLAIELVRIDVLDAKRGQETNP
jgi:hypothetical protein